MLRYGNLATALTDLGEYAGAKVLLEKQVKSDEKVYGEDNPQTTVSRSNLAMVLRSLGEFREAKSLLENVVKADEKNFGTDHTSTARSYSNLGLVLRDMFWGCSA